MKFALVSYGSRGDIEPCAAVGLELRRRGHEVRMAVPPNLVDFIESAGLRTLAYGPDSQTQLSEDFLRNFWKDFAGNFWKIRHPVKLMRAGWEPYAQAWEQISTTLASLAEGADLLFSGQIYQEAAASVAEYHNIPLATLHYHPVRVNGHLVPALPPLLNRSAMTAFEWVQWRWTTKDAEDAQRRELGLPKATGPSARRIAERGSLEIQAYDEVWFPELAAEWNGHRPFVGALSMEFPTDADDEVMSWIAAGTPPVYFGFGSIPVESPAETVAMIADACAQLGERALICAGGSDLSLLSHNDHVKVVDTVNLARIFPACRAVVHHGGAGTTAAGLRAGVPTLVLWTWADQPFWGAQVKRLKVGTSRRFWTTSRETLVSDLRTVLAPQYARRAREVGSRMTKPAASVSVTADLLEKFASSGQLG